MSSLIFNSQFHQFIKDEPFVVADIGARGNLQSPWYELDKVTNAPLTVLMFEADEKESELLKQRNHDRHIILPHGLWKKDENATLHLCGGQSAIHEPNIDLIKSRFEDKNWRSRADYKKTTIKCRALDSILHEIGSDIDFIKCDTQGSEYEIFAGGERSIKTKATALIAETWLIEAHKGQKLSFEVEKLCHDMGYDVILRQPRGMWCHKIEHNIVQRAQETQDDTMFFVRIDELFNRKNLTLAKALKLAAIAEYYGFNGYALQVLERAGMMFSDDAKVIKKCQSIIIDNNKPDILSRYLKVIIRKFQKLNRLTRHKNLYREL